MATSRNHGRSAMTRLKSVLVIAFIGAYLSALSFGTVAHALKVGLCGNTLSFYVVWDMFCGWTAWDARTHLIAEGASGQYYDVRAPWGEFHPFGHLARIHHDNTNDLLPRHIQNVLRHTAHEPIDRVYTIEEVWPKQYNLPPGLYDEHFGRPNDKLSYYHLRAVFRDDGTPMSIYPDWHAKQKLQAVYDNPRLRRQSANATSLFSTLYNPSQARAGSTLNTSMSAGLSTN
jgi:hypothetical protein